MPDEPESDLVMAARHVAEGRRIVAQQRARIARLKVDGNPQKPRGAFGELTSMSRLRRCLYRRLVLDTFLKDFARLSLSLPHHS
jgi:hypothetical protein